VLQEVERRNCDCLLLGRDYQLSGIEENRAVWQGAGLELTLDSVLPGAHQMYNLAGVVAGLSRLIDLGSVSAEQVASNFHGLQLAGRLQLVASPLAGQLYVDVGHNPDAARALAKGFESMKQESGKLVVLLGMLEDKQPDLFVEALGPLVDRWWLTTLDCDRGLSAEGLQSKIGDVVDIDQSFDNVADALDHALSSLGNQDIMLVTGSFVTVELLLRALPDSGELNTYGSEH